MLYLISIFSLISTCWAAGQVQYTQYPSQVGGPVVNGAAVTFSSDGRTIAWAQEAFIQISTRVGDVWTSVKSFSASAVRGLALSSDGTKMVNADLTLGGSVGVVSYWSADDGNNQHSVSSALPNFANYVASSIGRVGLDMSADGEVIVMCATITAGGSAVTAYNRAGNIYSSELVFSEYITSVSVADDHSMVIGFANANAGVGGFAYAVVSQDFSTLTSDKVIYQGNDAIGQSMQGTAISISGNGEIVAVGGPGDDQNEGAVWLFQKDSEASTWSQMTTKQRAFHGANQEPNAINGLLFGASVGLDYDGETMVGSSPSCDGIGAYWIFARLGRDVKAWRQQGEKTSVQANIGIALSHTGNELAVLGYTGLTLYDESLYMRIKISMWGVGDTNYETYTAQLKAAFAGALSLDVSDIYRIQYKSMTGHGAEDVEAIASIKCLASAYVEWGPVDVFKRLVLHDLWTGGNFKATVAQAAEVDHIGDVMVRTYFSAGF